MLTLFRKNIFINNIFLLLYAVLLQVIAYSAGAEEVSFGEGLLGELIRNLNINPVTVLVITILLTFFQAALINRFSSSNRLDSDNSMFPGMTYILFVGLFTHAHLLNSSLIANTFVILSFGNIFEFYKGRGYPAKTFNAGFFMIVAGLIHSTYLPLVLFPLTAMISYRKTDLREVLQIFLGILTPLVLAVGLYYLLGRLDEFPDRLAWDYFNPELLFVIVDESDLAAVIFYCLIILITFLIQGKLLSGKNIHARNKNSSLYFYYLFAALGIILFKERASKEFLIMTPVVAYLFSGVFNMLRPFWGEILHLLLLVFYFYNHFFL